MFSVAFETYIYIYILWLHHGLWKFPGQELIESELDPFAGDRTPTSTATQAAAVRFLTHCPTAETPEDIFGPI